MTAALNPIPFWFLRHGETDWNAQGLSRRLPGMVIGRGSNPTAAEDHIVGSKRLGQCFNTASPVIAKVVNPRKCKPSRTKDRLHFFEMTVLPLAGENLVTKNKQTKLT